MPAEKTAVTPVFQPEEGGEVAVSLALDSGDVGFDVPFSVLGCVFGNCPKYREGREVGTDKVSGEPDEVGSGAGWENAGEGPSGDCGLGLMVEGLSSAAHEQR